MKKLTPISFKKGFVPSQAGIITINDIIRFRNQTTSFPSTTHTMTPDNYRELAPQLIDHFKEISILKKEKHLMSFEYRTNMNLPSQMIEVTISK